MIKFITWKKTNGFSTYTPRIMIQDTFPRTIMPSDPSRKKKKKSMRCEVEKDSS